MNDTACLLRPAGPEDAETIAEIWYRGWLDAHLGSVPEGLIEHRQRDHFRRLVARRIPITTVAVIGSSVAGFVTIHDDEVEQVYVAATARRRGVANALLRHAEERIAERFDRAWLAVVAGNARARRFYERNGWHDGGAFDYSAEAGTGTFPVPCQKYIKQLGVLFGSTGSRCCGGIVQGSPREES